MSKFDYGTFFGGYDNFAVSKEKYTKEQAIELYGMLSKVYQMLGTLEVIGNIHDNLELMKGG